MLFASKLQKMNIKPAKLGDGEAFEVMFNPETYSLKYENTFAPSQAINTSGKEQVYAYSSPQDLSLTLILDNSGAARPTSKDVKTRVNEFLQLTTEMNGETHAPRQLIVEWGSLNFECYLQELEVTYTLFDRSGYPIRAELNVSFIAHIPDDKRISQENKSSPDVTHEKTVNVNDNLPLMANQVYQDATYYIQVAQANRLNHFRDLKVGTALDFPPLDK